MARASLSLVAPAGMRRASMGSTNGKRKVLDHPPVWASWRGSRVGRCIRFIESFLNIPSGAAYGKPFKLAPFQREILEVLLADDVRTGGLQICRGNAKSTLTAAVGLFALVAEPDAPQVPLVAFNSRHADRTLFKPIRIMLRYSPAVADHVLVYTSPSDRRLYSVWNEGELYPLPANDDALQGLNPSVAIIDEAQTVPDHVLWSIRQGAGKRASSLTLAIGTPGPDHESALYRMRELAAADGGVTWHEYSAPVGCDVFDRDAWHAANPALKAGILDERVLEDEAKAVALDTPGSRAMFRMYRLGHWIEGAAGWLPPGSFDDCPYAEAPRAGSDVILALDGSFRRSTAIALASLPDCEIHYGWSAEQASDDEVMEVILQALEKYNVVEIVHYPKVRKDLIRKLEDLTEARIVPWKGLLVEEVTSANEMHRAIVERRLAHDHHPVLMEHMENVHAKVTEDGLRLSRPLEDGRWIDAAMAARMAWWRALAYEDDSIRMFVMD